MARCPGEGKCDRFTSAAAPKEDACKACDRCEGRAPLPPGKEEFEGGAEFLDRIAHARRERDSGGGLDLAVLSPLEWSLVMLWDSIEEAHREAVEARTSAMLQAFLATQGVRFT